ncbi:SCO family protein [Ktedonosporobacter rubrisoli]|uniref:SCO family protein n=1 Tax=Ktedonosporobacter rubrisoli TaxID=2509675 RepID=A0A4P6JPL1_KTERU|nr:SCO family protein [Ktedonosporobacter rubrisoli]QBD77022.1 SCO family protein [Ktedonosporobacter rubrisoli]
MRKRVLLARSVQSWLWIIAAILFLSACGRAGQTDMSMNMNTMPSSSDATTPAEADLGKAPGPDFRLQDQQGKPVALSQLKGNVVVLSFLYTHCPDMCPLAAEKFHQALSQLGDDAKKVSVLAVSVDPANDTEASAQKFSQEHRLDTNPRWHFLLGKRDELIPIWKDYHIYTDALKQDANGQAISHMGIVYLIDQQGKERTLLPVNFSAKQLANDIKGLLKES